jgi:F-type H+-transporting ATPase subunit delta
LEIYYESKGLVNVEVTSAAELDQSSVTSIKSMIAAHTGAKEVNLELSVNPGLIGGLIIKYGDNLMDTSITTQIRKLKKELNIA